MHMPATKPVSKLMPFCTHDLRKENEDGISTMFYLQNIFSGIIDALPGISVLKRQCEDLNESSETVAVAFGCFTDCTFTLVIVIILLILAKK
nr:callose synthase 10 [Tanacetum cinerariifolium]